DVVGNLRDVREEVRDLLAGLPVLVEVDKRPSRLERGVLELGELLPFGERLGERLPVQFLEHGLVVEGLELRGAARHTQMDDAFRLRRHVRWVDDASPALLRLRGGGCKEPGIEQAGECKTAEAVSRASEEGAAVDTPLERDGVEVRGHDQYRVMVSWR